MLAGAVLVVVLLIAGSHRSPSPAQQWTSCEQGQIANDQPPATNPAGLPIPPTPCQAP